MMQIKAKKLQKTVIGGFKGIFFSFQMNIFDKEISLFETTFNVVGSYCGIFCGLTLALF